MAIRMKTKWHRSKRSQRNMEGSRKERSMTDLAGIIAFNIWKLTREMYTSMEKEGFHFGEDEQVINMFIEIIAFMIQVGDRTVYGKLTEEERAEFVSAMALDLTDMIETNKRELLGEGEYRAGIVQKLNARFADYSECPYDTDGPSYEFRRLLGHSISQVMAETDNKWVLEQIMDIEVPKALKNLQRMLKDVLGLKKRKKDAEAD